MLVFDEKGCRVAAVSVVAEMRNTKQWKALEEVGWDAVAPVVGDVVRGKIRSE